MLVVVFGSKLCSFMHLVIVGNLGLLRSLMLPSHSLRITLESFEGSYQGILVHK